jgi:hypothetical protein
MPRRNLRTTLTAFIRTLNEGRRFAAEAYSWASRTPGHRPTISVRRRNSITEHAFLHSFLAWEAFLEESFVLYLSGQRPPRGRAPQRYSFPPNIQIAMDWVVPEGKDYAMWTIANHVANRAERFFRHGAPYASVLRGNQNTLDELRILRNAIAHSSTSVRRKFETLVRNRLGILPMNLTVGAFLWTSIPASHPPRAFIEDYLNRIEFIARQIVPS